MKKKTHTKPKNGKFQKIQLSMYDQHKLIMLNEQHNSVSSLLQ